MHEYLNQPENIERYSSFVRQKFGYGRWEAPVWVIGMEEGGGVCCADVIARINHWRENGAQEWAPLNDLPAFCGRIGQGDWFESNAQPQPTWNLLIELLMRVDPVLEQLTPIEIQMNHWGRQNGNACLVDFSPLPSPRTSVWHYATWLAQNPDLGRRLSSRHAFLQENGLGNARAEFLRKKLEHHAAIGTLRWILFYGKCRPFPAYFNQITGGRLAVPGDRLTPHFKVHLLDIGGRVVPCLVAGHPLARGRRWTADELNQVRQWLLLRLG